MSEHGTRTAFVYATREHDNAALRISATAERKLPRIHNPGVNALKIETDRLVRATEVYAAELGMSPVLLGQRLHQLRREGVELEVALDKIEGLR